MKNKISIKKRFLYYSIITIVLFLIFSVVAEFGLRILGHHPASPKYKMNIKVEPAGKYFMKDSVLGYTHLPGKFYVTQNDNYTFVTTHDKNTLRITHPLNDTNYVDKPKIWIMGGSDTHGWSINDEETYAWVIQEMYNANYEILNFGCSGYGTIHSLLQIEDGLKYYKKPEIIVIAYHSSHDLRNTFLLRRRKAITKWNFLGPLSQPYATFSKKEGLKIFKADTIEYKGLPLNNHSALINFLEKVYIYFEDRFSNSQDVTRAIMERISSVCQKNKIKLVIAGMDDSENTKELLKYCNSKNLNTVDLSVDFINVPENLNLPHDYHPSPYANKQYAQKLRDYLTNKIIQ